MKKIRLLLVIVSVYLCASIVTPLIQVFAVTPTPTLAEKDPLIDLKTRIASRVAELNLVDKRGFIGKVTNASSTQITLVDPMGETKYITIDEITKFTNSNAKGTFGISDITKDMPISVLGLYNKESKRLLARYIDVVTIPVHVSGEITETNRADFTVTITKKDQTKVIVDIENTTTMFSYIPGSTPARIGFSRLTQGAKIVALGNPNKKEKNRMSGIKLLIISGASVTPSTPAR